MPDLAVVHLVCFTLRSMKYFGVPARKQIPSAVFVPTVYFPKLTPH